MSQEKILVVDDEEHIVELLKFNLVNAGYKVISANNGMEAVQLAQENKPDLVLLDIMLPGIDGLDVCKELKREKITSSISIIMLTAKEEELDKIIGLELGADDYITKPFSIRELLARVKAVLRRTSLDKKDEKEVYEFGRLKIDEVRHEIKVDDKIVDLTLKEYELLESLVKNKGLILKKIGRAHV